MKDISIQLKVVLKIAMNRLREECAPTSMRYNDMALMIAYGESNEGGIPLVNADMISRYLTHHSAVPSDARMSPQAIQKYLERLARDALIVEQSKQGNYRMRDDISRCLVENTESVKSQNIDEFLFHGFRLFSSLEENKK